MPQHALYPDEFAREQQDARAAAPPTREDRLVRALLNMIRNVSITAAPPAHIQPTPWSIPIDLSALVTVPAAAGPYVPVIDYIVPPGRSARISGYGVNVRDPAYTYDGSILWRFTVNGHGLDNGMQDWGIQRGSIMQPRATVIVLKQEDILSFQVRRAVAAAAPQDVEMTIQGWTWIPRNNFEGTANSVTAY